MNNDLNTINNQAKDRNVLSFMYQLVQERHGDDTDINFLNSEADRLYFLFGNKMVEYFASMLNDSQKAEFSQLINNRADQNQVMEYLANALPDMEGRILKILAMFRNEYLQTGFVQNK